MRYETLIYTQNLTSGMPATNDYSTTSNVSYPVNFDYFIVHAGFDNSASGGQSGAQISYGSNAAMAISISFKVAKLANSTQVYKLPGGATLTCAFNNSNGVTLTYAAPGNRVATNGLPAAGSAVDAWCLIEYYQYQNLRN